jgi:hypothetical protein
MISAISTIPSRIQTYDGTEVVSGNKITGKQSMTLASSTTTRPNTGANLLVILPELFENDFTEVSILI